MKAWSKDGIGKSLGISLNRFLYVYKYLSTSVCVNVWEPFCNWSWSSKPSGQRRTENLRWHPGIEPTNFPQNIPLLQSSFKLKICISILNQRFLKPYNVIQVHLSLHPIHLLNRSSRLIQCTSYSLYIHSFKTNTLNIHSYKTKSLNIHFCKTKTLNSNFY